MEFHITEEQRRLQERCRSLAADFASRAAQHDREASHPLENYAALRDAGLYALNIPTELGGAGVGLLGYSLAAEELAQGCASTALSFNMHLSIVGPLMESPLVPTRHQEAVAHMVVHDKKLIAGNYSEPTTSGLVGTPVPLTRARRVDGGYRITGRKAFASMLEAADYCAVMAYPDEATAPTAAMILLVPPDSAAGRRVEEVWDTLGMRATRSDSMVLDECWVADDALMVRADDIVPFRRDGANWSWASYTAVYLGVAVAAYNALIDDRPAANAARLRPVPGLSSGRAPARGGDERRPGGRPAPDVSLGVAQRYRGANARHLWRRSIAPSTSSAKR